MDYVNLIVNLAGQVRRETANGREYVVAPLVLIVPGVLNGSQGPLYYPADVVSRDPDAWNGMPLVRNHPTGSDGTPVSAHADGVFAEWGLGVVINSRMRDGKLVAEGWFDVEKARQVDPNLLDKIERGERVELSTGLHTRTFPAQDGSTHNGRTYSALVTYVRPDHVAILTRERGACSLDDGCGVHVANESGAGREPTTEEIVDLLIARSQPQEEETVTNEIARLLSLEVTVTNNEQRARELLPHNTPLEVVFNCECETDNETTIVRRPVDPNRYPTLRVTNTSKEPPLPTHIDPFDD